MPTQRYTSDLQSRHSTAHRVTASQWKVSQPSVAGCPKKTGFMHTPSKNFQLTIAHAMRVPSYWAGQQRSQGLLSTATTQSPSLLEPVSYQTNSEQVSRECHKYCSDWHWCSCCFPSCGYERRSHDLWPFTGDYWHRFVSMSLQGHACKLKQLSR